MTTNEFDDNRIVKELKNVNMNLDRIFNKLDEILIFISTEPKEVLTKEKVEKDFSDLKSKLQKLEFVNKAD